MKMFLTMTVNDWILDIHHQMLVSGSTDWENLQVGPHSVFDIQAEDRRAKA